MYFYIVLFQVGGNLAADRYMNPLMSSFMHAAVNCHAAKHKTRSRKFELALIYTGTIGEATSAMNDL